MSEEEDNSNCLHCKVGEILAADHSEDAVEDVVHDLFEVIGDIVANAVEGESDDVKRALLVEIDGQFHELLKQLSDGTYKADQSVTKLN